MWKNRDSTRAGLQREGPAATPEPLFTGQLGRVLQVVELDLWWTCPVVGRGELTDKAWVVIEPLLPPQQGGGRRSRDHRQVINAILWKLRTGAPWRDLPDRYGPWKTAYERLRL